MSSQSKALTSLVQTLPSRSTRLVHTLKRPSSESSKLLPKDSRALSYESGMGAASSEKKSEVDEWSNGLRQTLMSNLSTNYIAKSKLVSSNNVSRCSTLSPTGLYSLREEYEAKVEPQRAVIQKVENKTASDMMYTKEKYFEESNWATMLQKTVDLSTNDLSAGRGSEERKKLSMDINVVVKINPHESESKIGFQEINKQKRNSQTIENAKTLKDSVMLSDDSAVLSGGGALEKMSHQVGEESEGSWRDEEMAGSLNDESSTVPLMTQDMLIQELGKVYSFHKNHQDGGTLSIGNEAKDEPVALAKVKELFFDSLKCSQNSKEACEEGAGFADLHSSTTQPTHPNGEPSPVTRSLLDISNLFGNGTPRRVFCRTLEPPCGASRRHFTTSSLKPKKKDDCDKAKKLPCLQASELSKTKAESGGHKSVCEKFCMPCCKPARDPPECFYPYHKPPCDRQKPPRPAFSECKQMFAMKQVQPCECIRPRASTCKKSKESQKCAK